jgi:hypothetical protein
MTATVRVREEMLKRFALMVTVRIRRKKKEVKGSVRSLTCALVATHSS